MIGALVDKRPGDPLHALCLGAHSDDIEIGCGGTLLELAASHPGLSVDWVVLSAAGERAAEAEDCAQRFLAGVETCTIRLRTFRDGYFPHDGDRVKDYFEELKSLVSPDVLFTHFRDDWHQDHRLVSELTWNTWRRHLILEYEIPKYDPDLGSPNLFVPLSEDTARLKVQYIIHSHRTQAVRSWCTPDALLALMRLRGVASGRSRYAEGFYCRKLVLTSPPR
jgi:LmbE family N-acetylglucosaminyl deacetylase